MQEFDPTLYPSLVKLDENVKVLLASDEARSWSTERVEYEICRIHPIYWMEQYGFIRAGAMSGDVNEVGIIPFQLNAVQLQIADRICAHLVTKPWTRIMMLILKHRKAGISTLCAAFDYWFMKFVKNFNAFLIADLGSHTDNIAAMIDLCRERDLCGVGLEDPIMRPSERVPMPRSKKGMKLTNGSMLEQDSGENSNPGTSGTIIGCHMSENAKWRDPLTAETSLLNSIPRKGFVCVIKESTAFGLNKYAQDCETAEKGESAWEFVFISWKDFPDCEYELGFNEVIEYTKEENELVKSYDLRSGHIKFRRSQIELLGSEQKFKQDFPLNSREPFLITGSNYFDAKAVDERIEEIRFYRDWKEHGWDYVLDKYPAKIRSVNAHPRGLRAALNVLDENNVTPTPAMITVNQGNVTFVPIVEKAKIELEALTMFHPPVKRSKYLVIIDPAEGIQNSEYTSDNGIVEVFDTARLEQVAEWGGVFDEEVIAHYAVLIARLYNDADIVVEMNNKCGGTVKAELEKTGYRHFFCMQKVTAGQQIQREFGWHTSRGNKKEVCTQLKIDFKNKDCLIHSIPLLEEMLFFIDNQGKLGASSGHTDDRVMATSIGLKIIADTPAYHRPTKKIINRELELPPSPQYADLNVKTRKKQEILKRYM